MGDFAIGYDFGAYKTARYHRDASSGAGIDGITSGTDAEYETDTPAVLNLQSEDIDIRGKFIASTNQRVVLNFDSLKDHSFFAALNCNFVEAGRIWLHYSHNDQTTIPTARQNTTLFSPGASSETLQPAVNSLGDIVSSHISADGTATPSARLVHIFTRTGLRIKYLGINLRTGSSDAVEVGRFIGGKLWRPERNPTVGATWHVSDTSTFFEQPGKYSPFEKGTGFRRLECQFSFLSETEAEELRDVAARVGRGQPIFVIFDTDDPIKSSMYCRLASEISVSQNFGSYYSTGTITFEEIVPRIFS